MDPLILGLIAVVLFNWVIFPIAYKLQTDKLTDITYSLSFAFLVGYGFAMGQGMSSVSKQIIAALVLIWAIRLGYYLLRRVTALGKDSRFDEIRINPKRFFRFFSIQGFGSWIISIPFLIRLLHSPGQVGTFNDISTVEWSGLGLALIGFLIEAIADQQKSILQSH